MKPIALAFLRVVWLVAIALAMFDLHARGAMWFLAVAIPWLASCELAFQYGRHNPSPSRHFQRPSLLLKVAIFTGIALIFFAPSFLYGLYDLVDGGEMLLVSLFALGIMARAIEGLWPATKL
jgi:hypothetical protein